MVSHTHPLPVEYWALGIARGFSPVIKVFEKYGRNSSVGTSPEDVWGGGGLYTGQPADAEELEISSNDAADAAAGTGARTVLIQGLLNSAGVEMPDRPVTLNGTGWVDVNPGQPYLRGNRIRVITGGSGGSNAGNLTLRQKTTTTNIFAVMPPGKNRTAIAAFTVPLGKTLWIDRWDARMIRPSNAVGNANVSLRARAPGADRVYEAFGTPEITDAQAYLYSGPPFEFEEMTDIVVRVDSASNASTIVTAEFSGYLITP